MTDRSTILQANADTLRTLGDCLDTAANHVNPPLLFLLREIAGAHRRASDRLERMIGEEGAIASLVQEPSNARARADEAI
jgi:hypothetical protein